MFINSTQTTRQNALRLVDVRATAWFYKLKIGLILPASNSLRLAKMKQEHVKNVTYHISKRAVA